MEFLLFLTILLRVVAADSSASLTSLGRRSRLGLAPRATFASGSSVNSVRIQPVPNTGNTSKLASGDVPRASDSESEEMEYAAMQTGELIQGVTTLPAGTNPYFPHLRVITSLPRRNFDNDGIQEVLSDVKAQRSGALAYSSRAQSILSSGAVLGMFKDAMTAEDSAMRDLLRFEPAGAEYKNIWISRGRDWLWSWDPRLGKLQRWVKQSMKDLTVVSDRVLAMDPTHEYAGDDYEWEPTVRFVYHPSGTPIGRDGILHVHADNAYLAFSTSNVAGLTVGMGVDRLNGPQLLTPVLENTFYVIPGVDTLNALFHAVAGGEAAINGRVSAIFIFDRRLRRTHQSPIWSLYKSLRDRLSSMSLW